MKTRQLQIRVSEAEKKQIKAAAKKAGMSLSEYVLKLVLSQKQLQFAKLVKDIGLANDSSFAFAAMSDFISNLNASEFEEALGSLPQTIISLEDQNYLAAMIEYSAALKGIPAPDWTMEILPLSKPFFGSEIKKIKKDLLLSSPVAFRKRNIFVDSSVGDRV